MPLTDEERELLAAGTKAKDLLEHPAWKVFAWNIERQIASWTQSALRPALSHDEALRRNTDIGTINGLRLALNAPADTVALADEVRARLAQEDEEDDTDA